jgi:hypothetical protein
VIWVGRRLAAEVEAILPVRFGTLLDGERVLADVIAARAARLREALALVAGREQMTLRVFGEPSPAADAEPPADDLGPGARYLEARRRRARRDADVPEAQTLTPEETERIGLALTRLEETIRDIGARFGLAPEDLNLDLGPLGRLT